MYGVAIHETHPDHPATLAWFNVDASKPTLAAAVKKACAHEAHD